MRTLLLVLLLATPAGAQDYLNLPAAVIHNSPADIAAWPITVRITGVTEDPRDGFALTFDQVLPDRWKWASNPANPSDNYQFTVWAFVAIDGVWHGAGFIDMWQDRPMRASALPAIFSVNNNAIGYTNWWGDSRHLWDEMSDYVPHPGDLIGLMISAGNARRVGGVTSVRERSNVVLFALPGDDRGAWTFGQPPPTPPVQPPPIQPPPVTPPPVVVTPDLSTLQAQIAQLLALEQQQATIEQDTNGKVTHIDTEVRTFSQQFGSVMAFVGKYIAPALAAWFTAKGMGK